MTKELPAEIPFGSRVAIEARLDRMAEWERQSGDTRKFWRRQMMLNTEAGILIGYRTLSNGTTVNWGEGGGIEYRAKEHFLAALVVTGPRSKPFLALPADVKAWP